VLTQFPRHLNSFSSSVGSSLSSSSLADSPETCEEPEGLVSLPGAETDIQIRDIPIVTEIKDCPIVTDGDMHYMKTLTPAVAPSYLTTSNFCSSPDTSSLDTRHVSTRDFDHMYASLTKTDPGSVMAENVHLREMLVSQLDLIQQQSETILSKDKQLQQLREENGLLVQRLSRMERRCRSDPGKKPPSASSCSERKHSGQSQTGGIKRLRESEPIECVKKKKVEELNETNVKTEPPQDTFSQCDELFDEFMADMVTNDIVSRPETPASCASGDTINSDVSQTKKSSKNKKKLSLEGKRKAATTNTNKAVSDQSVTEPRNKKTRTQTAVESVQLHETLKLYYVGCKNDVLPNVDDHLDEVATLQRGVEVPSFREDPNYYNQLVRGPNKLCIKKDKDKAKETSGTWRIKSTNPVYSGDTSGNAEDISDQTILKRHERHELEEKRRKRWDLQRLREEQQLQRLRARQEKQICPVNSNKRDDSSSLLPCIENASHVNVDEKIPVSAFGRPLPSLPQTSFSLPWMKSRHSL